MIDVQNQITDALRQFLNAENELTMFGYTFYLTHGAASDAQNNGKWYYFFQADDVAFAQKMCRAAISDGVCVEAKHTSPDALRNSELGVMCFYCNADDMTTIKTLLLWMVERGLVRRKSNGQLYNMPFDLNNGVKCWTNVNSIMAME